ncbi:MAG: 16S rRNA (guanine(527)-N(7))-methyltransferase RsmG [Burkholderiales bacterium]|nr:16S rRNA (guanine(527)-N(7))-methyltransferase RsmG [Burkholderiales bacterium]
MVDDQAVSVCAPATTLADELVRGADALGVALTTEQRSRLLGFIALLVKWNRTYNLTAIRAPERMLTHHLLDALAVLPHLPQRAGLRVLDVGSGGGIPGIPLAIARPDWQVALADANHKKAAFLMQAAIELRLPNAQALAMRVENLKPAASYDVVISRAFADLATFAAAAAAQQAPHGLLVAMKGVHPEQEIAALPPEMRVLAAPALTVPGLGAARHLVIMQRAPGTVSR